MIDCVFICIVDVYGGVDIDMWLIIVMIGVSFMFEMGFKVVYEDMIGCFIVWWCGF